MFIAVEGIDGSGKSTLTNLIGQKLSSLGLKVYITKEPTERFKVTREESSRHDVQTATELFFRFTEDRLFHQKELGSGLNSHDVVLTDRYLASSLAYQGVLIEPLFKSPEETVKWMLQVSSIIKIRPDLTLYLDIDPETALKRIANRGEFSGFEDAEYLSKVRNYYQIVLDNNVVILDGTAGIEEIAEDAVRIIIQKMG